MERQVEAAPDQQVSLTDPDARSMATSGKGTAIADYNVQTAAATKYHLIVAHEVTNAGHDRTQLVPMGVSALQATGCKEIIVLADRGYFNGDQVLACADTGVLPCIPKTLTSSSAKRGLFTRRDFFYDAVKDHYICPAGRPRHGGPLPPAGLVRGPSKALPPHPTGSAPDEGGGPIGPPGRHGSI